MIAKTVLQKCSDKKSLKEELNAASSVKKVYAVMSGKGGVGKSLVTSMLAVTAQRRGFKTAVLDADITGRLYRQRLISTRELIPICMALFLR